MVTLHHSQPEIMNLRNIIAVFICHRRGAVTRHTIFELRKTRGCTYILEALVIVLASVGPIVEPVRRTPTLAETKATLVTHSWGLGNVPAMLEYTGDGAAHPE